MTDQQLIEAVLTSCGWRKAENLCWYKNEDGMTSTYAGNLLTSLDACKEVFEKDAPEGYWDSLWHSFLNRGCNYIPANNQQGEFVNYSKATARQRCLAWLKFKGVEGV